jgi:Sulfotransferase domain
MAPDRNIVWIVSYPKSGNTWVRFLVCNLVFGVQDSAAALNRLAPDIHELSVVPALPTEPVFMKTHFPFSPALPLAACTAGAIYVVRDPADVMMSNYHYSRRDGSRPTASPAALAQYIEEYLAARGGARWIELGMGAWDDHVRSWLAIAHPFPVLTLRYEDLLRDSLEGARQLCAFLGLERTAEEMARAVAGGSFERLQKIEEQDIRAQCVGIFYKPYLRSSIDAGLRFMRAGQAGEAARVLSEAQLQRVHATFGPLMRELGYGTHAPHTAISGGAWL